MRSSGPTGWFRRTSPGRTWSRRCSCTAAGCTSAATCCTCGSSATTSRTGWGTSASPRSTAVRLPAAHAKSWSNLTRRTDGRGERADLRRARGVFVCIRSPASSRCFRLVFIQFVEVPAVVFLGLWFLLQFLSGVGSDHGGRRPAFRAASRSGPTWRASWRDGGGVRLPPARAPARRVVARRVVMPGANLTRPGWAARRRGGRGHGAGELRPPPYPRSSDSAGSVSRWLRRRCRIARSRSAGSCTRACGARPMVPAGGPTTRTARTTCSSGSRNSRGRR